MYTHGLYPCINCVVKLVLSEPPIIAYGWVQNSLKYFYALYDHMSQCLVCYRKSFCFTRIARCARPSAPKLQQRWISEVKEQLPHFYQQCDPFVNERA